ncbi:MAG: MFS transporter [Bacteroidota bacterium]
MIYTPNFLLLCLSALLFSISFNIIIPELPNFLEELGGEDYKGLIISLFALTAGLSRPFSGKLTDTIGRIPVMIFGTFVCVVCSLLYPILTTVAAFMALRFFHGLSTGFKPTGLSAYVADIVPATRRGEAMGIIGIANSLGIASGPVLGQELMPYLSSLDQLFYISSAVAVVSIVILLRLPESLLQKKPFRWSDLKLRRDEIIEPRVFPPSFIMMCSVFAFGIVLTIIPDFSEHLGLENKGLYYAYFIVGSLSVRIVAGKISDRFGRVKVLLFASAVLVGASVYTVFVTTETDFFISAVLAGVAIGFITPTLFAWTIDLSLEEYRGRAMATLYIALEIGIATGAFFAGWIYDNDPTNFSVVFTVNSVITFISFLFVLFYWRNRS